MFILTNWKVAACITPGGVVVTCLCGHVFGHTRFKPGEFVQTSHVRGHRVEFDSLVVVTRNGSEYWLGKPDPCESFAMQRLLRYLQENASVQTLGEEGHTRMPGLPAIQSEPSPALQGSVANLTMFRRRSTDQPLPFQAAPAPTTIAHLRQVAPPPLHVVPAAPAETQLRQA